VSCGLSSCTLANFQRSAIIVQLISSWAFANPPYNFMVSSLGLINIAGFIGVCIGVFFGGKLLDVISNRITSAHNGVREPEYRLYAFIIPAIIGPMGVLLFGLTITEHRLWIEPVIGLAMNAFGVVAMTNVLVTYAVDSYLPLAGEVLVATFVVRGVFGTVLTLYINDWIEKVVQNNAFGIMVGVQYFMCAWVVMFIIFGRRIRARTAMYGPLTWG